MNPLARSLNTLLLTAILTTLLLIWQRMPPTVGDLKGVKGDERKALLLRRPAIQIEGEVTGDVSASIAEPLEVKVVNDPLDVFIVPQ